MSTRTREADRTAFVPEAVKTFTRRRLAEAAGCGLLAVAGGMAAALVSYNPLDPSLNTAGAGATTNWIGAPGAWFADLALQSIGLASSFLVAAVGVWGWSMASHRGVARPFVRVACLAAALIAGALALAGMPAGTAWPLNSGLGGVAGDLLRAKLAFLALWGPGSASLTITLPSLFLGLAAFVAALGLGAGDWLSLGRNGWRGAVLGAHFGMTGARAGLNGARAGFNGARAATAGSQVVWRGLRKGIRLAPTAPRLDPAAVDPEIAPVAGGRREPRLDRPREARLDRMREPRPKTPLVAAEEKVQKPARGAARQQSLELHPAGNYRPPSVDILNEPPAGDWSERLDEQALTENARLLESVLDDFGVKGEIVKVRPGPVVTLYELEPAPGTKSSRVINLADDIARSMSAISVRVAVIPGRNVIGIELPNASREVVYLREMLSGDVYRRNSGNLVLALGKEIGGNPVMVDLARMPHLLIAGTTGSGKSVAINTMILSLLYRLSPEQCRFIMIDPKMLELSVYEGIPHLLAPVVTDPGKSVVALRWVVREMENRYRAMSALGVRNVAGYNARLAEARKKGEVLSRAVQVGFDAETGRPLFEDQPLDMAELPFIVVVVDEMADLMLVAGKDVEQSVQRLAQMARAAGIHLIMATQRPSVDVITGTIKANFPTRVSFQVTSKIDSRTILGESGAEQLLGQGDMLYMAGGGRITRVHGPFVTDEEVERVVAELRDQGAPDYIDSITEGDDDMGSMALLTSGAGGEEDDLYDRAVALVCHERKASTSFVQRHLQIGYNRAARIIERMETEGVISGANHVGKREVLARNIDDRER